MKSSTIILNFVLHGKFLLFIIKFSYDIFALSAEHYPHRPCFGTLVGQQYVYEPYYRVLEDVLAFGSALDAFGISPRTSFQDDHLKKTYRMLGVMGVNSPIYGKTLLAAARQNITTVPLYATLGKDTLLSILRECELTSFVVDINFCNFLCSAFADLYAEEENYLKDKIITLMVTDADSETSLKASSTWFGLPSTARVLSVSGDLLTMGRMVNVEEATTSSDDVSIICYTSGSTGRPKGVVLTHKNILAGTAGFIRAFNSVTKGNGFRSQDTHYSYLPFAHIFETCLFEAFLASGARIAFQQNASNLWKETSFAAPTKFFGVPRVYSRLVDFLRNILKEKLIEFNPIKSIFIDSNTQVALSDEHLEKLTEELRTLTLGPYLHSLVCGGAALSPATANFLKSCLGVPVVAGYGMTETVGAGALACQADTVDSISHIGGLFTSLVARLDQNVGNQNSTQLESQGRELELNAGGGVLERGELLLCGRNIFQGYFRNENASKEALFVDEENRLWFRTGDIAEIHSDHFNCIKLVDRKKNLIKLANGEFVPPEKVEAVLNSIPNVANAFVGVSSIVENKWCVLAALEVSKDIMHNAASFNEFKSSIHDQAAHALLACGLPRFACPKGYIFLENDLSFAGQGLLTAAGKLRRDQAKQLFEERFDRWFENQK